MERFLEYWQAAWQQYLLHSVTTAQVQDAWTKISREECLGGAITQLNLQPNITPGLWAVIPQYAQQAETYFYPYMLLVEIDSAFKFVTHTHLSLPIVPHSNLEPAPLQPICLGQGENFSNFFAINPPEWFDAEQQPSWEAQLAYATAMLTEVTPNWPTDIQQLGWQIQDDCLLMPLTVFTQLDLNLSAMHDNITLIDAALGTDVSKYTQTTKKPHTQLQYLQVLYSIWLRQQELVTKWNKIFDYIPALQKYRLQRLYAFFKQNFPNDNVNGFTQEQLDALLRAKIKAAEDSVSAVVVTEAQYIDPIQGFQLFTNYQHAVIIGNYNPICSPRYPVQIDYELTKYYGLVDNEADFEDLQFDGVLMSVGNMWSLFAKDRDADEILTAEPNAALEYEFIDIKTSSAAYHGSLVNQGAISSVLDWLDLHATTADTVAIYTCFAGQADLLKHSLSNTQHVNVPILLIQNPCVIKTKYALFVPVYTAADPGPYIFDRGMEMFDQLLANTQNKLIVVGDRGIFKPNLHSATGKFARLFNAQTNAEPKIITEEAECV